jgi:hypothetical protein
MKKHNTIICSPIMILMDRDGITYDEAKQRVIECRDALLEANNNPNTDILADEIIMDYLGLEPDYFFDIMSI